MSNFICPVCGNELINNNKSMFCSNNHNFDVAKSGYVNLLLSQKIKAKHHGDDKLMVNSRRDFLNKGYYNSLLKTVCEAAEKHAENGCCILDAGCGECWYTTNIYEYLLQNQIKPEVLAIDISKDALAAGAKRNHELKLAVASVFHLPIKAASCDMILSIFAPYCDEEFKRVIKKGGIMIRVIPLEKHLLSLKKIIYSNPYQNDVESYLLDGFELLDSREIRETIHLPCNQDIVNLFAMTPYFYKTSAEDQSKIKSISELDTEIEFGILTYRKK